MQKEIERLIAKGYLCQFLKNKFLPKQNKKELGQSATTLPKINVILEGTSIWGILTIEEEV